MTDTIDTLRQVTDEALSGAREALIAGWERLSATDIDPAEGRSDQVGAEMGAITEPLGAIARIRRRRHGKTSLVDQIVDYDEESRDREEQAQAARNRRNDLIQQALADGTSAAQIADVTGLHIQRVYQIRDDRR